MLSWAATMFAWNAKPPNPRYFGGSWIEEWRKRLEKASKSWDSIWLLNNNYNNYWKNGSICEDYSRVDIPGKQIIGIDLKLIKNQYFQVLLQDVTRKLRKFAKALNSRPRPSITVLAIGGWTDSYTNPIFRLVDRLPKCRAVIGPWSHEWPDTATPGPNINFVRECKDFWDAHLKV